MKFYQVISDDARVVFKHISTAKLHLSLLKKSEDPDTYERITFDCMDITINSDTVLDILNGNGYCTSITNLELP